jgi:hypothetical protein
VVGEQFRELDAAVACQAGEPVADAGVREPQLRLGDRPVRDLADQRVAERQLGLPGQRRRRPRDDEPAVLERAQRPRAGRRQARRPERAPDHRRVLERALLGCG